MHEMDKRTDHTELCFADLFVHTTSAVQGLIHFEFLAPLRLAAEE